MLKLSLVVIIAAVWFLFGFLMGLPTGRYADTRTCETFAAGVVDEWGMTYFGYVDLCGYGLEWGEVQTVKEAEEWN